MPWMLYDFMMSMRNMNIISKTESKLEHRWNQILMKILSYLCGLARDIYDELLCIFVHIIYALFFISLWDIFFNHVRSLILTCARNNSMGYVSCWKYTYQNAWYWRKDGISKSLLIHVNKEWYLLWCRRKGIIGPTLVGVKEKSSLYRKEPSFPREASFKEQNRETLND